MDVQRLQLIRFLRDFKQSREFAEYIVKRRWRDKGTKSRLAHLAFNTALIVSYTRPFTCHINADGRMVRSSPLDEHICNVLTLEERKLHKRLTKSRDTTYAHSDASAHLIAHTGTASQWMYDPFHDLLTKPEVAILQTMIDKWINHLKREKLKLGARLQD